MKDRARGGEEATSSAIAFAMAGVLFVAAISTVLVYANDRIPPPSKSRPHDELSAEARVLMQSVVLTAGTATWDGDSWTKAPTTYPGLRCATCAGGLQLDADRVEALANATRGYGYEELRTLLGMEDTGRGFNITITNTASPGAAPLLAYGEDLPQQATRPDVAYLRLDDGTPVRVTVHVFLFCEQGACLAET